MAILPVAVPHGALVAVALAALHTPAARPQPPSAPAPAARDSPLTAAVLYNSARFVTWPADVFPDRGARLNVCVLGHDPFGAELDDFLSGKTVGPRRLAVRRAAQESELAGCHVLFIGASEAPHLDRVLAAAGRGVLTLSAVPRFAERGGMIGFVVEGGRVRFEINRPAVRDADLVVSSRLLKLARVIR